MSSLTITDFNFLCILPSFISFVHINIKKKEHNTKYMKENEMKYFY